MITAIGSYDKRRSPFGFIDGLLPCLYEPIEPLNHNDSRICTKEIAGRVRITPEVSENSGVQSIHAHNEKRFPLFNRIIFDRENIYFYTL
jgi:hypothetical protein